MPPPPAQLPDCPAGLETCPVLPELRRLEEEYRLLQEECRRLQKLSQTDPLTRLFNRGYLMISLEQEMERTRRTGFPTSLIMLDLDHFKRLNDTYGHQFGDEVLCRVAVLLKDNIRKLDIPCRYGGEEFVVILPGTRLPQAVRLAVRLNDTLAQSWQEDKPGNTPAYGQLRGGNLHRTRGPDLGGLPAAGRPLAVHGQGPGAQHCLPPRQSPGRSRGGAHA